ncbi:hypothetical protein BDV93DRAFT_550069 [Ceratobasidium sp. AG-I]|nr:hypothetical protein BDV93DRAFT_550069 [Ceratobasidium sp. AG-I]
MNSDSKERVYVFSTAATSRKTVRFAAETTKEILEKSTWRKAPEPRSKIYVLSARGQLGLAVIRFAASKILFIRLPTARRTNLESYLARLLSLEQIATWWPILLASKPALVSHSSNTDIASSFCETFAELSEQLGNQTVSDLLAPLVIPLISSWESSGEIASVDDSNRAAKVAAQGMKGVRLSSSLCIGRTYKISTSFSRECFG